MNELLTVATLLCSLAICARLLTYRSAPDARYRRGVSICAWVLIVTTGGQALQIMLQGARASASGWQLILLMMLLLAVYRARGNVANLLGGG